MGFDYAKVERPFGVTVIAVLAGIGGVLGILGGIGGLAISSMFSGYGHGGAMLSALIMVYSLLAIIFGVLDLILAWGLWNGFEWAWLLGVILSGLGALIALLSLINNPGSIISLIVNGIILYYLFKPEVKAYFGRA